VSQLNGSSRSEPVYEHFQLSVPAIVVHGGAGAFERVKSPHDAQSIDEAMRSALDAGWAVLEHGGSALDAVVEAVATMEESGIFNAGRSGARTVDDKLELDAAVMDGSTGVVAGVCATTWPRNPIRAALALSGLGGPADGPVLLAGAGADQFAEEVGLPQMDRVAESPDGAVPVPSAVPESPNGTVGAVAVDSTGHVAAATSTGGRSGQRSGRVGDSAIPGAGTWADDDTVAVSATGEGESFVVAGFGHLMDWSVRQGATLPEAAAKAMAEVTRRSGTGGAIILRASGEVLCTYDTRAMARGWRHVAETRTAVIDS